MGIWVACIDMCNVSACYIIAFIISLRFFCIFHWVVSPQPIYVYLFLLNLFAAQRLVSAKRLVVAKILTQFDASAAARAQEEEPEEEPESPEELRERRRRLQERLETGVELPEVAEFVHGGFGRVLIEISLAFLQWSMTVFHYQLLSFSLVELVDNFNQTRALGITYFEPLDTHMATPQTSAWLGGGAFVLFSLLSLTRSARQCGIFSLTSLLCFAALLGLIFYFLACGCFGDIDVPRNGPNVTDPEHQLLDAFSQLYLRNHRLMFTQAVGGILTIECSMVGTRHLFYYPLFISGFAVIGIGCFFIYGFGGPYSRPLRQLLLKLNSSSVFTLLMCVGVTCAFPLQNAPIYRVFEKRCLSRKKCCCQQESAVEDETLQFLFEPSKDSFLTDVRRKARGVFDGDVAGDLQPDAPWCCRYTLRSFVVLTQIAATFLFIWVPIAFKIFCMLCLLASRFLAYMFPSAAQLSLAWFERSWPQRLTDILVIVLVLAEITDGMRNFIFDWDV